MRRKKNLGEVILLEGADLTGLYLSGIDLSDYGGIASISTVRLKDASLPYVHLEGAKLHKACLEGTVLAFAHLDSVFLLEAHLEGAYLQCAALTNANVCNVHLEGANLVDTELEGSKFDNAYLQKAKFQKAQVDGKTSFCYCEVDRETDFREVGLESTRIDQKTKQLLEYNIRRMKWEEWYKWKDWFKHEPKEERNKLSQFFLRNSIGWFWSISDYGKSTGRIIASFIILALLFAAVYLNWAYWAPPGIVHDLSVEPVIGETSLHYFGRALIRPVYFSVVTMTTLGFGDMYANKGSIAGHVLLILQVILGYVLLGALVTRFAVLFTAGGPAGKFTEKKMEEKQNEKTSE
jgi:hypothetical protein